MTAEELKKLIADGESDRLEFKETTGQRGEACRTLCAFLNGAARLSSACPVRAS